MQDILDFILHSKHLVALTGAGMSTESGLPDFRSQGGLWSGKDPFQIATPRAIGTSEFIDFFRGRIEELAQYQPNIGHEVLAQLEKKGILKAVLTQNIDGFHQRAGSQHVVEVHGHLRHLVCSKCQKPYPSDSYTNQLYHCEETECGGDLRPPVILFEEMLDPSSWAVAMDEVEKADTVIVLGTSLQVYPFAGLVEFAYQTGAKIALINKTETPLDGLMEVIVYDQIGETLGKIKKEIWSSM
ncbi:NAD-dependent protein deacylase [Hazenella coriacea]|uniref:protein acetyllysine N-acetyltransferase n=1 Tax=Hazenella coriacea TaxID=1179467 RepID=A0A4R3L2A5_9BACL|nr:NAD-dependent protein deacylase [Hazenella coriacea]TCS93579.1 NAD-dependent deacetylase [Hazenella coriacea]